MYLRCFIAVDIPVQIKSDMGDLIAVFKKYNADVKWAVHENLHLTLKFLGKTSEDLLPKIAELLSEVVLSYKPFCIKIYGAGVFPHRKYPRVIWVGIEDSGLLKKLQEDVENAMTSMGFKKEEREFRPHLTLGRVRSQKEMANIIHELDALQTRDFGSADINSIKLMQSELRPTGARYSCLQEIPLGRGKNER
jgi:RNA 2',3'-cyclic 3'-phosphodiesterase